MAIIPMKCTSCGGSLEISSEMEHFSCGYCGTAMLVERKGGTIALKMVTDGLKAVQAGTDKTAAELALKRLESELFALRIAANEKKTSMEMGRFWCTIFAVCGLFCFFLASFGLPENTYVFAMGMPYAFLFVLPGVILFWLAYAGWPSLERIEEKMAPILEKEKSILQEIEKYKAIVQS